MITLGLAARHTGKDIATYSEIDPNYPLLGTMTYAQASGSWNAETRTSAGTTNLVAVKGNQGLVITDLVMTTDKSNGSTASIVVTDGVNSKSLIAADITDAPCNISVGFAGRMKTWKATYIDLVTTGVVAHAVTVTIGYYRIPAEYTLSYTEWIADQ